MCTNMRGASLVHGLEAELGIPIVDSTAAAVWSGMRRAGDDPAKIKNWGRIFEL
jgi:maleate isomerase